MDYQAFLKCNAAIAAALGGDVVRTAGSDMGRWSEVAVDGVGLSLHFDGWQNKDRVRVSINWPKNGHGEAISFQRVRDHYNDVEPDITVSTAKTPERIAADIKRRFLEVARPLYAKALERAAEDDDYATKHAAIVAKIVKAGGARIVSNGNGDHFHGLPEGFEVKFISVRDDSVDVRLRVSVDELCAMLRAAVAKAAV